MKGGAVLPHSLQRHECADWIAQTSHEITALTDDTWLVRETECHFTEGQWRIFSDSLTAAFRSADICEDGIVHTENPAMVQKHE